jgi:flagellin
VLILTEQYCRLIKFVYFMPRSFRRGNFGLRVNTNISALEAQRPLKKVARETEESYSRLSSGERITKAADDAAGLAISEKLKAEIRSSHQANRNANDGISLVQVAEGALSESSSLLARLRELAIQSASDTVTDTERSMTEGEYQALKNELQRISQSTQFNGKKLLDGHGAQLDFQVGVGDHGSEDVISYSSRNMNSDLDALGVGQISVRSKTEAQNSLGQIDRAIDKISAQRSQLGSIQNRLATSSSNLSIYTENMSSANNRIRDTDYAVEAANAARNTVIRNTSTAVAAQANISGQTALKLL